MEYGYINMEIIKKQQIKERFIIFLIMNLQKEVLGIIQHLVEKEEILI